MAALFGYPPRLATFCLPFSFQEKDSSLASASFQTAS